MHESIGWRANRQCRSNAHGKRPLSVSCAHSGNCRVAAICIVSVVVCVCLCNEQQRERNQERGLTRCAVCATTSRVAIESADTAAACD
jgi:hypothetical protein